MGCSGGGHIRFRFVSHRDKEATNDHSREDVLDKRIEITDSLQPEASIFNRRRQYDEENVKVALHIQVAAIRNPLPRK